MNRFYWRYTWSMLGAGVFSIALFFALGAWLCWVKEQRYYSGEGFWDLHLHHWGGIPFWFLGMLSIIAVHAVFLFRLAFLTASLELPWRRAISNGPPMIRTFLPVHFLKILSVDILYVVFLVLTYHFLSYSAWR